jgi:transposase
MTRAIEVTRPERELRELERLHRVEKDARVRQRMGGILARWSGVAPGQVAATYRVTEKTVTWWVKRFNRDGVSGLVDKPRSGRPPKADFEEVRRMLAGDPRDYGYPVQAWNGKILNDAIRKKLGVTYDHAEVYYIIKQLGFTFITPRSRSYKASADERDAFKKTRE